MKKISPLKPKIIKSLPEINGLSVGVTNCGLKKKPKEDLVLIKLEKSSPILGCFTKSKTPGEPIKWNKSIINHGRVSAILINSGNANVFNGKKGELSLKKIVKELSLKLNIKEKEIYIASTGVIGELLDETKIIKSIPSLIEDLNNSKNNWLRAAKAIMTTDTFEKLETSSFKNIVINGIAKGSGMIAPNMATMLGFVFTNIKIEKLLLKKVFLDLIEKTFNSITVDGDMSTSDMVLLVSVDGGETKTLKDENDLNLFFKKLNQVLESLSHQIIKDGEGARKFITIEVSRAKNYKEAKLIAMSIANSPLFKTAIAGEDSNWGRIVMAIGKVDAKIDVKKLSISFSKYKIIKNGELINNIDFNNLDKYLKNDNINISIDMGLNYGYSKVWTCDFTEDYISINADYRS